MSKVINERLYDESENVTRIKNHTERVWQVLDKMRTPKAVDSEEFLDHKHTAMSKLREAKISLMEAEESIMDMCRSIA